MNRDLGKAADGGNALFVPRNRTRSSGPRTQNLESASVRWPRWLGAEDLPPAHSPAIPGGIAPEIAEIVGAGEIEVAGRWVWHGDYRPEQAAQAICLPIISPPQGFPRLTPCQTHLPATSISPAPNNFRDLGGYPARDGRAVRWRQIFRSNHLGHLTEAEYRGFASLGPEERVSIFAAPRARCAICRPCEIAVHSLPIEPTVVAALRAPASPAACRCHPPTPSR